MIYPYKGKTPVISPSTFLADYVTITGDVTIGENCSIWFNTSIRGDVAPTIIGNNVNIQDNSVLHQNPADSLLIEDNVTIGHSCIIHSATLKKGCLIGMGSIVLDGAVVGEGAFIGAGSLIPPGKVIPPHTLALGRPAKVVRELNDDDKAEIDRIYKSYVEKGQYYKKMLEEKEGHY